MKAAIRTLICLLLVLVIATAGFLIPKYGIDPHVGRYAGERAVFARFALQQAKQFFAGSLEEKFIMAERVELLEQVGTTDCGYEPFTVAHAFRARVRLYTVFGLPYGMVNVDCNGVYRDEYHFLRFR